MTRVFLAGATGVIGIRLVSLLRDAGYDVFGTTRFAAKAQTLVRAGATPVIVDVFDAPAVEAHMIAIGPAIVVHQLTDLHRTSEPGFSQAAIEANALIRREGTKNLVAAARAAGAARMIAQSIAWVYEAATLPHAESDPLDRHASGLRAITIAGVVELERLVMNSPPIEGTVLRYGRLYGPGTGVEATPESPAVHVDAAAYAALLAVGRARSGIFNVAELDDVVDSQRARRELGWSPSFRCES